MPVDTTRYDLKLDSNGDLLFSSAGDLVIAPSDEQHIQDCINAGPCWWKEYPSNGCNIGVYVNGSFDLQTLEKLIRQQLYADGYTAAPRISYDQDGTLIINANVN